jgi:xylulokinase
MNAYSIIADIGTGAVKAECFSEDGISMCQGIARYPAGSGGRDEIDPELWFDAFSTAIRELGKSTDIRKAEYLVLTGQMQDLVLVSEGRAIRDAILYFAHRSSPGFEGFLKSFGAEHIAAVTKNTPDQAGFPAKLFWLEANEATVLKQAEKILCGAHDYIAYRLTGTCRTDPTTASTTGLMDPVSGTWAEEILISVPRGTEIVPEIRPGNHEDGVVTAELAAGLGISPGMKLIHGVGDVGSSTISMENAGFRRSCYLGTSGWVLDTGPLDKPGDPFGGVFNLRHPTEDKLIRVAPLLTAAGSFDWLLGILDPDGADHTRLFEELSRETAGMSRDECRLIFLPYLSGERSPFKDPDASGLFMGLTRETGRRELFRAVEEGLAFSLRSVLESLDRGTADIETTERYDPLILSGGGASIKGLAQIIADTARVSVAVADDARYSGTGALLSILPGGAQPEKRREETIEPAFNNDVYAKKYELFRDAYRQTKELMHALKEIQ